MPREKEYGGQQSKTPMGIDFLLELTTEPKNWIGEGTGEKGYNWQKIGE
jgi:hypothetical protein